MRNLGLNGACHAYPLGGRREVERDRRVDMDGTDLGGSFGTSLQPAGVRTEPYL